MVRPILRSGLFNSEFYRRNNQDIDFSKVDPLYHYLDTGWLEGRDPSADFSTSFYLESYPDVKAARINPLVHYIYHGRYEGRKKCKKSNTVTMNYKISTLRRLRFFMERIVGHLKYGRLIKKNREARILVCLHLFYMESWPVIAKYLENLSPYKFDLIVTYVDGMYNEKTLSDIIKWCPAVKLKMYPNLGFDVGPFVDVLRDINLDAYDIVFKLHSKGTSRKFIYIYEQIFKTHDWFFNLFNGVLSGINVHISIDKLLNSRKIGLIAASNLVVNDPPHKQYFTNEWASKLGIGINNNYRYVAGTCYAVRSHLLKPIKMLGLTINDFEKTERGFFSLAHAMERIVCACVEPAGFTLDGNVTQHPKYDRELAVYRKFSAIRLLYDKRFKLDYDFFYRVMEMRLIKDYRLEEVRLGDIRRLWQGKLLPLTECHPYKYLKGEKEQYLMYTKDNNKILGFSMSENRYDSLIRHLDSGIDAKFVPVLDSNNVILDGQHRCCYYAYKYGEDYKVTVLKIYLKK